MRGLYVHLPFCLKKCAYCDFLSYTDCYAYETEYVEAVLSEFSHYKGEQIDTVYIGGGTPTSLTKESLTRLLDGVFQTFSVAENAEITVECNPKTADFDLFCALLAHGANRLSVGVQSMQDEELSKIGRIHTAKDAVECILDAYRAGFFNISADLMFGLPNQTIQSFEDSIEKVTALPVTHVSCYGLILENDTPLCQKVKAGQLTLPDEETEEAMYRVAASRLSSKGFLQYEISNFAKEGFCSRHNLKYWDLTEYIGVGAGAHSFYQGARYCHTGNIHKYIENPNQKEECVILTKEDLMAEFMMLGLRKLRGVSEQEFYAQFKESLHGRYGDIITKYETVGLLRREGDRVFFTERGIYLSNTVLCEFV